MKISVSEYKVKGRASKRWMVSINTREGRKRRFFETKGEAESCARQTRNEFQNIGDRASDISDDIKLEALKALEILEPYGKSIGDAVEHYIKYLKATQDSIRVGEAIDAFLAFKMQKGKSIRYLTDLRSRLKPFYASFENHSVSEITPRMVEDWLAGLPVGNVSRNNSRRIIGVFFTYCVRQGRCIDNPIKRVEAATIPYKEVPIFSPSDMALMLSEAKDDILAYLAIGAFAGLRDSEIKRLKWEQIKLSRGIIDLTGNLTKTAASRVVTIEPVLAHYLKDFAFENGNVCKPNFIKRMQGFREQMEKPVEGIRRAVEWQHNGLRHSYATYYYGLHDAGLTAKQLGHNGPSELFKHYRKERVDPDDATTWFHLHEHGMEISFTKAKTAKKAGVSKRCKASVA